MATAPPSIRSADGPALLPEHTSELALIERIAGSEAFKKSSRLPALLRYLAACTLQGDRAALTEQAIGRAVFEKRADFHPTEDSSVRVHVRQLRLRLYEYFQSAGQDERIIIEIPKGGYALAFHSRHTLEVLADPDREPMGSVPLEKRLPLPANAMGYAGRWLPWALCAAMLLLALVGWLRWYRAAADAAPPWPLNQVIESDHPTTLVLADASYVLRLLGDRQFTLDEYADRRYIKDLIPPNSTRGELTLFHYLQDAQITSMADARAVSAMTTLAGSLRSQLAIRSAKELTGVSLSTGNFIIVGAKNSNPWTELYESRTNFKLMEHGEHGDRYVQNTAPRVGEKPFYSVHESTGYSGEDFATISLVPGLGDQSGTLLIQGLRREGTDAAILFLSSAIHRASLERSLRLANHGQVPKYFEALLQSHAVAGSATSIDCIAVRAFSPVKR